MTGWETSGPAGGPLHLGELLASVALATDLGTGQPLGHGLRACALAVALAEELACRADDVRVIHQFALLRFLGCTSDAAETAVLAGGDDLAFNAAMAPAVGGSAREMIGGLVRSAGAGQPPLRRARLVASGLADVKGAERSFAMHCEVATMLASRAGLGAPVVEALGHAYERWDGKGYPAALEGEAIPLAVRVASIAGDAVRAAGLGDDPVELVRRRSGLAYDPAAAAALARVWPEFRPELETGDEWDLALAAEPVPRERIDADRVDAVLAAFCDFADLKSPSIRGHSRAVAALAESAARHAGLDPTECTDLRRAGLVHDLGRVAVPNGIWDKPSRLTTAEWERVRMHPYFTERILSRCSPLRALVGPASSHHERLDGSGYHRAIAADGLSHGDRILAAADVLAALRADRSHRPAQGQDAAARTLEREAAAGRLDKDAVACVLAAAGSRPAPARAGMPAGLSDREVEVLRLIARGSSNRDVAKRLVISPKTVGRHVENVYRKIGVSSRAAAAVFAMEHRLLDLE